MAEEGNLGKGHFGFESMCFEIVQGFEHGPHWGHILDTGQSHVPLDPASLTCTPSRILLFVSCPSSRKRQILEGEGMVEKVLGIHTE